MVRDVLLPRRQLYFCRLGFGRKGVVCFLEGAKIKITPPLGCCGRLHSVLLWLCCEKWCLAAAIKHSVLAAYEQRWGARAAKVSHAALAAQPVSHLPSAEEIAASRRGGFPGAWRQHRVRAGRNPGPLPGRGTQLCPRSSPCAWRGVCVGVSASTEAQQRWGTARPPVRLLWALHLGWVNKSWGQSVGRGCGFGFWLLR